MGSCHGQIRRSGHRTDARRVAIYVVTCRNLQEELTLRATTLTGVGRLYLSHISSSTPAVSSSDDFHSAFWTLLAKVGLSGLISDSVPTIRPSPFGSCNGWVQQDRRPPHESRGLCLLPVSFWMP